MFLGEILAGLYQFIINANSETKVKKENLRVYQNTLLNTKGAIVDKPQDYSITRKNVFLLVFLSSVIDFLCYTATSYLCSFPIIELYNIHTEMRITPIFFMSILSWKFLHIEIFKHHTIAILIVGIGFITISVNRLISYSNDIFPLQYLILFFLIHSIYSIKQINDKYIIDKLYMSPYVLLFYQGIIGFVICLVIVGIFSIIHVINDTFLSSNLNYFENDTFSQVWDVFHLNAINGYLILLTITGTFVNIIFMLIKKFFSPTHRSIADSLNAFSTWAYLFCFSNTEWTIQWDWLKLLDFFGYLVIIIGSLMYNELLIVHVGNLVQDIIENIADRAEKDTIAASSMVGIAIPEEAYGNEIMIKKEEDVI